jgi:hypothetical protein
MPAAIVNPEILKRMEELLNEGEQQWREFQKTPGVIQDPVRFVQWTTSCLNLLDKLSASTNRFVQEFEAWAKRSPGREVNLGGALGVLKAAREEYVRGFAVDYHLAVASAVFGDLLHQAEYLLQKGYLRAAAVLVGAALEEALRSRARAVPVQVSEKDTLVPLLHKLKAPDVAVITEVQSKRLEAVAKIRNDAAHGGAFQYTNNDIEHALLEVQTILGRLLGER